VTISQIRRPSQNCSALPVAYSGIPASEWAGFATLILEAAYEATVLSAVLNAARGGSF